MYPPYSITKAEGFFLDGRAGGNVYVSMIIFTILFFMPRTRMLDILLAFIYGQTTTLLAAVGKFVRYPLFFIISSFFCYIFIILLVMQNLVPSGLVSALNILTSFRLSAAVGFILTLPDVPLWGLGLLEWSFISNSYLSDISTTYNGLESFHYDFMHFHNSVFEYVVGMGVIGIYWIITLFSIGNGEIQIIKDGRPILLLVGITAGEKVVLWILLMGSAVGTSSIFLMYLGMIINLPRYHRGQ